MFIAEGKGGHQRLIPVSARFFTEVSAYLDAERPAAAPPPTGCSSCSRGRAAASRCRRPGLDEILAGARRRAGLARATCHQLRHTCLTQLRKAGMALEAVQAQAGHASIESTRIYLHLGDDWLAAPVPAGRRGHRRAGLRRPCPPPPGDAVSGPALRGVDGMGALPG